MKLDTGQLTAYVLGELDDTERAAVEQALENDAEARALGDELRTTAQFAREALQGAAEQGLSEDQRAAILDQAKEPPENVGKLPRRRLWLNLAAACLIVVVGGMLSVKVLPKLLERPGGSQMASVPQEERPEPAAPKAPETNLYGHPQEARRDLKAVSEDEEALLDDLDDFADLEAAPGGSTSTVVAERQTWNMPAPAKPEPEPEPEPEPKQTTVAKLGERTNFTDNVSGVIEAEEKKSGSLQNVEISGKIQVRGHYFAKPESAKGKASSNDQFDALEAASGSSVSTGYGGRSGYGGARNGGRDSYGGGGYGGGYRAGGDNISNWESNAGWADFYASPSPAPPKRPDSNNHLGYATWTGHNTEAYDHVQENPFKRVGDEPLSTFSIDVDTASYANVRRFLNQGAFPPPGSVRIEELVNYFDYDYSTPDGEDPFAAHVEIAGCPWMPKHRLARIGLKGWEIPKDKRPPCNLVFLLDVSGSMRPQNKLPLVQKGMKLLVKQLDERDRVAIVVYAGASGLVLPSTQGDDRRAIIGALKKLKSGGSTNGGAGIELAYATAMENYIEGGVNRVILATDGDFNVGTTDQSQLVEMVEKKAKEGVFLTVLGFGMGNLKDSTLEKLADKGNGNYGYIDTFAEAKKMFVEELVGTLVTIAKDVKIQIEFNPSQVQAYRLIGYENRILAKEDFNDDTKDAGEIGAGHTVTALYELVPAGVEVDVPVVDDLKYQKKVKPSAAADSDEIFTLKLRYKQPDGEKSKKLTFPIRDKGKGFEKASTDFQFASSVASFGMLLRGSKHAGDTTFAKVLDMAEAGRGTDAHGYRAEFVTLVQKARALAKPQGGGRNKGYRGGLLFSKRRPPPDPLQEKLSLPRGQLPHCTLPPGRCSLSLSGNGNTGFQVPIQRATNSPVAQIRRPVQ